MHSILQISGCTHTHTGYMVHMIVVLKLLNNIILSLVTHFLDMRDQDYKFVKLQIVPGIQQLKEMS